MLSLLPFLFAAPTLASLFDGIPPVSPFGSSSFDWNTITPTADLEYHPCYDDVYRCARLSLPLDWSNASDPRRTAVAMMKLPATVPDDDPSFGGAIYTNPGGPGHSGVTFIPRVARLMQQVFDVPGRKHYEIVSFDPRGLGFTTPVADCFGDNAFARDEVQLEVRGTEGLAGGRASLAYNRALHGANAQRCKAVDDDGENVFEYLGTPSVARDMLEMLDRADELRKREQAARGNDWAELKRRNLGEDDTPRMQYVGFSYGTVLGNYFASMFPGRVHRMLLDSVCDINDYAAGPGWTTNVADLDAVFEQFLRGCHSAGPEKCAVAREGDKSWSDVKDRVWTFIDGLDAEPRATINENGYGVIVRGRDYRDIIGVAVYSPIGTFRGLARLLDRGIRGNVEALTHAIDLVPNLGAECSLPRSDDDFNNQTLTEPIEADAMEGVLCADGEDVSQRDLDYWQGYVDRLRSVSKVWGDRWAEVRFPCSRWPFTNKFHFTGPFGTPAPASADAKPASDQPSAPLLLFSNRLDPVTPLRAARNVSTLHPGSAVVIKESMGHGALVGARSACLNAVARAYLDTGVVPEDGTVCEADCGPWGDCKGVMGAGLESEFLEMTVQQRRRFPLAV